MRKGDENTEKRKRQRFDLVLQFSRWLRLGKGGRCGGSGAGGIWGWVVGWGGEGNTLFILLVLFTGRASSAFSATLRMNACGGGASLNRRHNHSISHPARIAVYPRCRIQQFVSCLSAGCPTLPVEASRCPPPSPCDNRCAALLFPRITRGLCLENSDSTCPSVLVCRHANKAKSP